MFGVREGTLSARSGNLNDTDFRNAIEAFTKEQAVYTIKGKRDHKRGARCFRRCV